MGKCFNIAATWDRWCRFSFSQAGLKLTTTDFGEGTITHCWIPKMYEPNKPNLLLLHGFGASGMWQWSMFVSRFTKRFNVYVPDLLFFGDSYTKRTEQFQAQCVAGVLEVEGVRKTSVVRTSYGGFVAYSLAAQFPEMVEKLVLCGAGVCMEEEDREDGMFQVKSMDELMSLLVPHTPEKMKEMLKVVLYKPVWNVPTCFLQDFIDFMGTEYLQEWTELINALHKERKMSNLPKIIQPTLIIWGEYDSLPIGIGSPIEEDCGHVMTGGKLKEKYKCMNSFLVDQLLSPKKAN